MKAKNTDADGAGPPTDLAVARWQRIAIRSTHPVHLGETGVHAERVTMPDVDGGVAERFARAAVHDGDTEFEGDARFTFGEIGAEKLVCHVEGPDQALRQGRAASLGARAAVCRGVMSPAHSS